MAASGRAIHSAMPELVWLLDGAGRVQEISRPGLGLDGHDVVGRRCAVLVGGVDEHGGGVCVHCPVAARLRCGAYTATTALVRNGRTLRCTGVATARGTEVRISTDIRPGADEVLYSLAAAVDRMRDRGRWFETLRGFLGVLRAATGAEAAELFLSDPERSTLLLTAHQGRDVAAFQERAAFRVGEGYPGIVAYEGTPLFTLDLPNDERYLRTGVKRLGYRSFLSQPLLTPGGVVGVVDLACRGDGMAVHQARALLSTIAPLLAAGLNGVVSDLSERGAAEVAGALREGRGEAARERMVRLAEDLSGARTVDLLVAHGDGGAHHAPCPATQACPVLRGEPHGIGVAGVECPLGAEGPARYCLPWRLGDQVVGVESVELARPPSPATQYMAPLMWLQHRAGRLLGAAAGADAVPGDSGPRIAIRAFGAFQVFLEGCALDPRSLGRRKAWVLFKLLVSQRGHVLTREELAERLWAGDDPAASVKRVHVLVSTLRKAIETAPQSPSVILSEGDGYTFTPLEPVELDVATFERLLDEADRSEGVRALHGYGEALRLYRGEFMAEEAYADWFELDRAYYRERATAAMQRSAALQEAGGRLGDAIVSLRRLLRTDPWHQPAYAELARLLELRGDAAQAARVLEQGHRVLEAEP